MVAKNKQKQTIFFKKINLTLKVKNEAPSTIKLEVVYIHKEPVLYIHKNKHRLFFSSFYK